MIVLIIPCYNETKRLNVESFLKACGPNLKFLFVDDGSQDGTSEFIQERIAPSPDCTVLRLDKNLGKAGAVRMAALELKNMPWWEQLTWFGYWDADLATPLEETSRFLKFIEFYDNVDSVWGSRVYRLGSDIKRSALRHYLGRGFATVVHLLLNVEAYDTQCGAKIFKKELMLVAFKDEFISRWIFDIEILLRLKDRAIVEYPLLQWHDVPGSKIKISKEILRVFRDILKIRKKYITKDSPHL